METVAEKEQVFRVSGADCSDEVEAIRRSLKKIGIQRVDVNLVASTVTVRHSPQITEGELRSAIEVAGVKIVDGQSEGFFESHKRGIILIGLSAAFLACGMAADWTDVVRAEIVVALFALSTLLAGALVFPKALRSIRQLALDMNVLMVVAVVGAFAVREYAEGATVVFLFSLAELLEAFSISRARQAIRSVLKLTPQMAQVKRPEGIVSLSVMSIGPSDLVIVRPGDSIPLDGVVVEGTSSVNQAPLTGESVPVEKSPGSDVLAGTINESGALTVRVTKAFKDTKISRVIKMIEEAQEQKAPSERFVDKFAKIYTPVIFILAIGIALVPPLVFSQDFDTWFYRALVLLVIACPCALVLATPISVVSGLASLARRGVLVKGGKYLEALGQIDAIALDKTGTITEGKFKVQSFKMFDGTDERMLLGLALSLERLSNHPLALAVLDYAGAREAVDSSVEDYKAIPGRGAEGKIDGHVYFVGNHRLAHELGVCTPAIEEYLAELEKKSLSVIVLGHRPHDGHAGSVLGIFSLGDTIRKNAPEAIRRLHEVGVKRVVVLSGDNQRTVDAIRAQVGLDYAKGDLLPENKVDEIKKLALEYKNIAMVGDGVNDAPALANATVGISMGAAGTDAAIETSDVSLMQDDLMQLSVAIQHGRRVLGVIRFNIAFAIGTKAVFLVLALFGISNLWMAVAADMGASILVTANALRLLKMRV